MAGQNQCDTAELCISYYSMMIVVAMSDLDRYPLPLRRGADRILQHFTHLQVLEK